MEGKWDPKDVQIADDSDEDNMQTLQKKGIPIILGFFVVGVTGFFSGFRSHTIKEASIYMGMYFFEALICEIVAKLSSSFAFQQSSHKFAALFSIAAVFCPLSYIISSKKQELK